MSKDATVSWGVVPYRSVPEWCPVGTQKINGELVYKNSLGQHLVYMGRQVGWKRSWPLIQLWLFDGMEAV